MGTKDKEHKITLYIIREHKSSSIFSTVVPRKGVSETDVAIQFMLECIAECGFSHHTVHLKNDQEPALQAVIQRVIRDSCPDVVGRIPSLIIPI